jgi:hypothetical protein
MPEDLGGIKNTMVLCVQSKYKLTNRSLSKTRLRNEKSESLTI